MTLNLHLQQLSYLREVARGPTFRAAALRLHVSQPALSQGLSELERRLGVILFERHGRRRRLTADGEEVAAFARSLLSQSEELTQRLEARRRGEAGVLRVGTIDAVSLYVLPGAVRAFRRRHPEVELRLTVDASAALLERLASFELDLAYVVGPAGAGFVEAQLVREPLFVYAPAGERDPRAAEWVAYPEGSHTRGVVDTALARLDVQPRITLESGNPEVLRQMVALGLGWTVLPARVAEAGASPLSRWRRRALARRDLVAVRRADSLVDPRVDRFQALARRQPAA